MPSPASRGPPPQGTERPDHLGTQGYRNPAASPIHPGRASPAPLLLDRADRELLALLGQHGQVAKVEGTAVTLAVETFDVAPDLARLLV